MPLETATYVSQLDAANPAHTDGLNASDAHARLIKSTLQATFPNFTAAALSATQAAIDAAVSTVTGLSRYLFPLGTAALPAITPIGDTDTGMYSSAANNVDFATAGVRALQIDENQKVQMKAAASVAGAFDVGGAMAVTGALSGGTGQLVPAGAIFDYAGATEPTGYLLCYGQAVNRTTYAALYAAIGTAHGVGDGVTTFNLPDCRGRASAGKDDMGGSSANRLTNQSGGLNGDTLGATGGTETHTLTGAESGQKAISAAPVTITDPGHTHGIDTTQNGSGGGNERTVTGVQTNDDVTGKSATTGITAAFTLAASSAGSAHNNVQPTIVFNKIIKT